MTDRFRGLLAGLLLALVLAPGPAKAAGDDLRELVRSVDRGVRALERIANALEKQR